MSIRRGGGSEDVKMHVYKHGNRFQPLSCLMALIMIHIERQNKCLHAKKVDFWYNSQLSQYNG